MDRYFVFAIAATDIVSVVTDDCAEQSLQWSCNGLHCNPGIQLVETHNPTLCFDSGACTCCERCTCWREHPSLERENSSLEREIGTRADSENQVVTAAAFVVIGWIHV